MRWGAITTTWIDSDGLRLPELGWRDQVADARARLRASLWPCAQAAAASGIAWLLAHNALGHAEPFFAPIAAAISLSANNIRRGRRILQMVAGVMIGIGVGVLASQVVGTSWLSIALTVLATMVVAMAVAVGFFGEGMMFVNQSVAAAVLVVALHKHGTGSERAIDALIGGGVAGVIGVGLFPPHPLRILRSAEREVLRSLAGMLGRLGELLAGPTAAPPGWTPAAAIDIHVQLGVLASARATARVIVRVAPRRRSLRAALAGEEERIARIDLLANAALSLLRVGTDALDEGDTIPAELGHSVRELAAALDALARARQPWPAALREEVAVHVRASLQAAGQAAAPRAPVLASAARATGRDVLAIANAA
ncbi:MAG TPA: FUSC family protein [Solirubrobacteraceae bacterium]|jgi:uncharacterized membrane protein YgaE (UPF0421/DUF939 family)